MHRIIDVLKAVALVSVCFLAVTVGLEIRSLSPGLTKAMVTVNAPKKGTIALLNDDLKNLRLTLDNANKAAIDERIFLEQTQPIEVANLNRILSSANTLLRTSNRNEQLLSDQASVAIQAGTDAVKNLEPLEDHLSAASTSLDTSIQSINLSVKDIDTLVTNPANIQTLNNVQSGTAALAATAKDGQQWVHSALHPGWAHKVWGVVLDVAHVFNPL